MDGHTRRSFLRLCGAGVTAGMIGATGGVSVASAPEPGADEFEREQARFVSKYATETEWAIRALVPLFDPPTDETLEEYFEESYTPSVASLVPGLVGDAVDLAQTLVWYEKVGEESGFRMVADRGVAESAGDDFEGASGEAMSGARDELQAAAERASVVGDRAQTCASDPSEANVERIADAMGTLVDDLDGLDWVERWAAVSPPAYGGIHPTAERAARRVQRNAEGVLTVASALRDEISDQRETVAGGGYLSFPSAMVAFDHAVPEVRAEVPGLLFDRFAGDTYHIRTENQSGEDLTVRWVDTDGSGQVASYELGERDSSDADVVLSQSTLSDIADADDSTAAAVAAYQSGDVQVSGNGFFNGVKYSDAFAELIGAIGGLF